MLSGTVGHPSQAPQDQLNTLSSSSSQESQAKLDACCAAFNELPSLPEPPQSPSVASVGRAEIAAAVEPVAMPTCVGINGNEVCPKGHDLRWHAWRCSSCGKRGGGLRFSCAECPEANVCHGCKQAVPRTTTALPPSTPATAAPVVPHLKLPAQPQKTYEGGASTSAAPAKLPQAPPAALPNKLEAVEQASSAERQRGPSKPGQTEDAVDRPGRNSSSSHKSRQRSVNDRGSVLSQRSVATSSVAQLLGPMAMQSQSSRPGGAPQGSVKAPSVIEENCGVGDSEESKRKTQARSGSASQPHRRAAGQRAGASVLSVKSASTSNAAGLLGPLLEQKPKR